MYNFKDMKEIILPLSETGKVLLGKLRAGEEILLSGRIYTFRDQSCKRLCEDLKSGRSFPISIDTLNSAAIYYCGPIVRNGIVVSCGPTTSARMDKFVPEMLDLGIKCITIGKGRRSDEARKLLVANKCLYLITIGGAGAYLAKHVRCCKLIAYSELGPEAVYELTVEKFPTFVGYDFCGNDIFCSFAERKGN